jgi:hypothetical protein
MADDPLPINTPVCWRSGVVFTGKIVDRFYTTEGCHYTCQTDDGKHTTIGVRRENITLRKPVEKGGMMYLFCSDCDCKIIYASEEFADRWGENARILCPDCLAALEVKCREQQDTIAKQAERLADIDGWEIDDSGVPEVGYRYRFLRQPVPNPKEVENG